MIFSFVDINYQIPFLYVSSYMCHSVVIIVIYPMNSCMVFLMVRHYLETNSLYYFIFVIDLALAFMKLHPCFRQTLTRTLIMMVYTSSS